MMVQSSNAGFSVFIYQEDLELIAAEAARHPDEETGGSLFGLRRSDGDLVVMLATPPGPGAVGTPFHFEQDVEVLRGWAFELERQFGLEYLGDWHSHHRLRLSHPSPEDAGNMASISGKTGWAGLAQWILNLREEVDEGVPTR